MCFITKDATKHVATENIPVRKLLIEDNGRLFAPYMIEFEYVPGRTYSSVLDKPKGDCEVIHRGLHSYIPHIYDESFVLKHKGFFDMYIPKGATYWKSDIWGEYVSNKLVFAPLPSIEDEKLLPWYKRLFNKLKF